MKLQLNISQLRNKFTLPSSWNVDGIQAKYGVETFTINPQCLLRQFQFFNYLVNPYTIRTFMC